MIAKIFVDDPVMLKLCRETAKLGGFDTIQMEREEVCRSDIPLIICRFTDESIDEILFAHPYSLIFVVGSVGIERSNVVAVRDIEELIPYLTKYSSKQTALPEVNTDSKKQHAKRKKISKLKCPFCQNDIGVAASSYEKHLKSCREYNNRPVAMGRLIVERQPNGESRGSYLEFYVPENVSVKDRLFRRGIHLVTDGPMIKLLNAVLRDNFRYVLSKEES